MKTGSQEKKKSSGPKQIGQLLPLIEKPKSSSTTGSQEEQSEKTGIVPTATGSSKQQRLPRPTHPAVREDPKDELPRYVRQIVSDPAARLISWLKYGDAPLDSSLLPAARSIINKLEQDLDDISRPADENEIIEVLNMIADMIQVELPEETGLILYIQLLSELPRHIILEAGKEILKTHKYRTMPLPAHFFTTTAAQSWAWQSDWMRWCISHCRLKLGDRSHEQKRYGSDNSGTGD